MAIYFFNIRVGDTLIPDEEGSDLPDLEAVKDEAAQSASDLREQAAREPYFASQPFCIEVQDEAGNQVLNQPVRYLNGLGTH